MGRHEATRYGSSRGNSIWVVMRQLDMGRHGATRYGSEWMLCEVDYCYEPTQVNWEQCNHRCGMIVHSLRMTYKINYIEF